MFPRATDEFRCGWRGVVETHTRIAQPWKEDRTEWESKAARKHHTGSGFLKRSAKEEERIAKGAQRQFRHLTTASLIYITFAGAPAACPFLPSQYSSHHNLVFFFNEIGQLDKGQISELKQISRGLARGDFNRSVKSWASINRIDASVGKKKYEKDKEECTCYKWHIRGSAFKFCLLTLQPTMRPSYRWTHPG